VLALTTGRVPCFVSLSFKGRTRTTTWIEEVAVGEVGGRIPPFREEEEDDDDEAVEEKEVDSEGETIVLFNSLGSSLARSFVRSFVRSLFAVCCLLGNGMVDVRQPSINKRARCWMLVQGMIGTSD